MVFRVSEETEEDLSVKISSVFKEISEKRTFEADQIGGTETGKVRPIKVSLCSYNAVHQILAKARRLKMSSFYRSLYIRLRLIDHWMQGSSKRNCLLE
jgi:hypothetical protein